MLCCRRFTDEAFRVKSCAKSAEEELAVVDGGLTGVEFAVPSPILTKFMAIGVGLVVDVSRVV
jgi:hypothetical protein